MFAGFDLVNGLYIHIFTDGSQLIALKEIEYLGNYYEVFTDETGDYLWVWLQDNGMPTDWDDLSARCSASAWPDETTGDNQLLELAD